MWPIIVTDVPWSVCASVGHHHEPYKTAEENEMSFGCGIGWFQGNHVLSGGPDPPLEGAIWGAYRDIQGYPG